MLQSFSNTVKDIQAVRLATLLKRDPRIAVSKPVFRRSSKGRRSRITGKIERNTFMLDSLFK